MNVDTKVNVTYEEATRKESTVYERLLYCQKCGQYVEFWYQYLGTHGSGERMKRECSCCGYTLLQKCADHDDE